MADFCGNKLLDARKISYILGYVERRNPTITKTETKLNNKLER